MSNPMICLPAQNVNSTRKQAFSRRDRSTSLRPLKQKSGKVVHAFAIEADFDLSIFSSNEFEMEWPPHSGKQRSFPEIDRVAYFSLKTARRKILAGQRQFIEELVARLKI
jgi:predicted NUDIX family NTP pyrophosphohydrolase